MKQLITHLTHYRYTAPVTYSIQTLRLTPRDDEHQRVLRWHIEAPGALEKQVDAYGNITHTLTLNHPHTDIELRVTGQVMVAPLARGLLGGEDSRLPVHAYCVQTPLTQADDTVMAFVREALPGGLQLAVDVQFKPHRAHRPKGGQPAGRRPAARRCIPPRTPAPAGWRGRRCPPAPLRRWRWTGSGYGRGCCRPP